MLREIKVHPNGLIAAQPRTAALPPVQLAARVIELSPYVEEKLKAS